MNKLIRFFGKLHNNWYARSTASAAYVFYALQSWEFMLTRRGIEDEGLYLVKGFLFATGQYQPYQDNGPWTNQMPLSFIIPGYIEKWFGPGFREGRYFFFILGLLSVIGFWIAAKRLGGEWWAAFAVGAVALNPYWIKIHSVALSYGLITFFGVWMLVFIAGENRKIWELCVASFFAGLMFMTRVNLAPLLFLLILYTWWQFGKKAALWTGLSGLAVVALIHAIYWPNILRMWAYWLPEKYFPLIQPWRSPTLQRFFYIDRDPFFPISAWIKDLRNDNWTIIRAFWTGIRLHIIPIMGAITPILLWPKFHKKNIYRIRLITFLSLSYLFLLAIHAWAAFTARSCIYWCFGNHLYFFYIFGIALIIISAPLWRKTLSWWQTAIVAIFVLLLFTGIGYGVPDQTANLLEKLPIPQLSGGIFNISFIKSWAYFMRELNWERSTTLRFFPAVFGLLIGLLFLFPLMTILNKVIFSGGWNQWGRNTMISLLAIFLVVSPAKVFSGQNGAWDCGGNVLSGYEAVGADLQKSIEPGSNLYLAIYNYVHLFYLTDIQFHPAQMDPSNFISESDVSSEQLLKFGFWDEDLKEKWLSEADYILVEGRWYPNEFQQRVESGEFEIYHITPATEICRGDGSRIIVLVHSTKNQ